MRISFDFDNCLSHKRVQDIAKDLIGKGYEVWIVTSRFDNLNRLAYPDLKPNSDIYKVATELGIPQHRIGFTNQQPKWILLNKGNFSIHVDDDKKELDNLRYYGIVKGVGTSYPGWYEGLYEHIKAVEEF